MYNPMLMGLIFLNMATGVNAMGDRLQDGEFIQLRNTTPERKESHRRLVERKQSLDRTPKVEIGDLDGRNSTSTSPREKLRRDSATRIKKEQGAS